MSAWSIYWTNFFTAIKTLNGGIWITFRHFYKAFNPNRKPLGVENKDYIGHHDEGVFTLQYPNESLPVPDNGRYRLHNEIEDCIVCDKCVKVCPVNCIDIKTIRSSQEIRKASDGSSVRLYASTFDIDMAKCMFCGLCTTVCPTECLTMTKSYDFSEFEVDKLNYSYTDLSKEQAENKLEEWNIFQATKKQAALKKGTTLAKRPNMPKIVPSKSTGLNSEDKE